MKIILLLCALTAMMFYGMLLGYNLNRPEKQTIPAWAEEVCYNGKASWGQVIKRKCEDI